MGPSPWLREILTLDPERDAQRIVHLDTVYEFPFDTTRSLEFALFRTFAVPSMSALLARRSEFAHRAQKRYDDTDLILSDDRRARATTQHRGQARAAPDEPAARALRRSRNEDFLYVLSTFVFEPIRWNARFGWRPLRRAGTARPRSTSGARSAGG